MYDKLEITLHAACSLHELLLLRLNMFSLNLCISIMLHCYLSVHRKKNSFFNINRFKKKLALLMLERFSVQSGFKNTLSVIVIEF